MGGGKKLDQAVSQKLLGVGCGYLVGLLVGDVGVQQNGVTLI